MDPNELSAIAGAAKTGTEILEKFMKKVRIPYGKFLTDAAIAWGQEVARGCRGRPVEPTADADAVRRLRLLAEVAKETETHCTWDQYLNDVERSRLLGLLNKLEENRLRNGLPRKFALVETQRGLLHAAGGNFAAARKSFNIAIRLSRKQAEIFRQRSNRIVMARDVVLAYFQITRCWLREGKPVQALKAANKAMEALLETVVPLTRGKADVEKHAYEKEVLATNEFRPVAQYAHLALMEAYVHNPRWDSRPQIRAGFWTEFRTSAAKYDTPDGWRTPVKIWILSDSAWVKRVPAWVSSIAADLYANQRRGISRLIRKLKMNIGGFSVNWKAAAVIPVVFAVLVAAIHQGIHNANGIDHDSTIGQISESVTVHASDGPLTLDQEFQRRLGQSYIHWKGLTFAELGEVLKKHHDDIENGEPANAGLDLAPDIETNPGFVVEGCQGGTRGL